MNKSERLLEIDHLRGLAMLAMILIHTSVYFLSGSSIIASIWNYSQFAVPLFVFCSAYLFFSKEKKYSKKSFLDFLKKRIIRLVKPYYIFMIVFFVAILLRNPHKLTPQYILQSISITGGIDINWLVLLFLCFTFLMPLIEYAYQRKKVLFWIFSAVSVISSIFFVFWNVVFHYKYIMWLPWSVLLLFTFFVVKFEKQKFFYFISIISSAIVFLLVRYIEIFRHHSLLLYDNKYPPTLLFLSFGVFSITVLYVLAQKKIFDIVLISHFFSFLSRYSYSLYFIHYILLYIISSTFAWIHFTWITFFLAVIMSSLITQGFLNILMKNMPVIARS